LKALKHETAGDGNRDVPGPNIVPLPPLRTGGRPVSNIRNM
jgi:hypothetical protein